MGESAFSMNYEFAVLGIGVNLQLSGGESFPMIEDEPVEKEAVEKKKNFFEEFVENIKPSGLLVSAIFGAIGVIATVVAAPLTGAAAVIGGAIAIGATVAAAFTELYTYGTAFVDTITGHETEDEVFLETVLTIGATTFVLVSGTAAIAGLAAVGGSGGGSLALAGGGTMALEGELIIGAEGAIAKALEVIIGGNLTGAIAVAASMGSNEGEGNSNDLKEVYNSIKESPNYPEGFEPRKNGTTKNTVKNNELLEKLREIESGTWKKIYKDGYDAYGNEVSIHYFQSESGKVFDVKVKPGWSN